MLAIDLNPEQILIVSDRGGKAQCEIADAFSVPVGATPAETVEQIKVALAQRGLSRSEAIVVVSRAAIEMRELVVPPAPDNELPDMVRFQARNEFASLTENWLFDFFPLPTLSKSTSATPEAADNAGLATPTKVLAAGLLPSVNAQINQLTDAGLKVKQIVLRPFAAIDLLHDRLNDSARRLIININGDQADMTVAVGRQPIATRMARIPQDQDPDQVLKILAGEIKRTLASSQTVLGDQPVEQIILLGNRADKDNLKAPLSERTGIAVDVVGPFKSVPASTEFKMPQGSARYAGLLGSLVHHAAARRPQLDFLNPRRPVVKQIDRSRQYLYGGLAAVAAMMVLLIGWWALRSQANEIAGLQQDLKEAVKLNNGSDGMTPTADQQLGEIAKIDGWVQDDINWLEELYQISERFLTPDDAIVDMLDAELRSSDRDIVIRGRVAGVQQESALIEALGERPYSLSSAKSGMSEDDPSYPMSSDFSLELTEDRSELIKQIDQRAREMMQ